MKKKEKDGSNRKAILIIVITTVVFFFLLIPIGLFFFALSLTNGVGIGNIALIPIEGPITSDGGGSFGQGSVSSKEIVTFIEKANEDDDIKGIIFEINSPGGSAVASDEIATAIKRVSKPTVAVIREAGASGGYWIASATDHIIANRMSITGSIGVISSYLEFSGLMSDYGIGYEQLISGKNKDMGTPFKKLSSEQRVILQKKIDLIHDYFVSEVSENRNLPKADIQKLATGEFYLGSEALEFKLIDELGDLETAKNYFDVENVNLLTYQRQGGFFELLTGVMSGFSYNVGEGIGSSFVNQRSLIQI